MAFTEEMTEAWKLILGNQEFPSELFETCLMSLQREDELNDVLEYCMDVAPKVYMEIGAAKCGTLYHFVYQHQDTLQKVVAIEPMGTPFAHLFEEAFPKIKFLFLKESSFEERTVRVVREFLLDDRIDILFIDGDKHHMRDDFLKYRKLAQYGIILIHDIFDDNSTMQTQWKQIVNDYPSNVTAIINTSEIDMLKSKLLAEPDAQLTAYEDWLKLWMYTSCGYGIVDFRPSDPNDEIIDDDIELDEDHDPILLEPVPSEFVEQAHTGE